MPTADIAKLISDGVTLNIGTRFMANTATRIWYQSFVDEQEQAPYISRLCLALANYADPGFDFEVHGISPPDRYLHPLTEFRCARETIRAALQAERDGCDAFVIGHFQEPGLIECRGSLDIPVIGLGESVMLYACALGRKIGLVTINPVFIPWHEDQIARNGLAQRVVSVRAINAEVATFMSAFEDYLLRSGQERLLPPGATVDRAGGGGRRAGGRAADAAVRA